MVILQFFICQLAPYDFICNYVLFVVEKNLPARVFQIICTNLVGKRLENHMKIFKLVYLSVNIDFGKFYCHINFININLEFSLSVVHVTNESNKFDFLITQF